jgi:hypothetical protein
MGTLLPVVFEQNGVPAVEISVAVHATNISWTDDGNLRLHGEPGEVGSEFFWAGLHTSPAMKRRPIISPEDAVRLVTNATDAKAVESPRFYRTGGGPYPAFGFWRVRLDRPVTATPTEVAAGTRQVDEVFVSQTGETMGVADRSTTRPEVIRIRGRGRTPDRTITTSPKSRGFNRILRSELSGGGTDD